MAQPATAPESALRAPSEPSTAGRKLPRMGLAVWLSVAVLAGFVLLALFAPWLWNADPLNQLPDGLSPFGMPLGPSWSHPLGTDELGRDVLARWLSGARISLWVGFSATLMAGVIGGAVGICSGYFRGWVDLALMRVTEVVMAFPTLLLAIGLAAVLPPSPWMVILTLGLVGWTAVARLVRGVALNLREQEFITAAESLGARPGWILIRHMLPNVMPTLVPLLALKLADMFLLEAALSFLGLGVRPPAPSWGNMIQEGQLYFRDAPWLVFAPGLSIVLVVLAGNILGDRYTRLPKRR